MSSEKQAGYEKIAKRIASTGVGGVLMSVGAMSSYVAVFRPKDEKIAGIVQYFTTVKRWKVEMLSAITGISVEKLEKLSRSGTAKISNPERRMLWFLFMLDASPLELSDTTFIITWGALQGDILPEWDKPPPSKSNRVDRLLLEKR